MRADVGWQRWVSPVARTVFFLCLALLALEASAGRSREALLLLAECLLAATAARLAVPPCQIGQSPRWWAEVLLALAVPTGLVLVALHAALGSTLALALAIASTALVAWAWWAHGAARDGATAP
jgi:hypothetical protein